mmetsp:Transcript_14569/g.41626  ORF Transcript_14569/g.41626 Transcript_14569/m.41626 type:complete len:269 (-) Transcript_14569:18-824(-)|eukprot:CAMPEP_0179312756 /NCGR_PEP_ID=MMETSP0797-20121207/53444_1 /TAXON_ID=47934 /ORGANISM="Dinophysis acuminata, Strain DAEP01" /LENGTH=268 /DNA_ID=CAMNT_0021022727 /DNA_START=109 /DNA_END=915 /DNA_ORIENTATION=+
MSALNASNDCGPWEPASCTVQELGGVTLEPVAIGLVEVDREVGVLCLELCLDCVEPLQAQPWIVDPIPEADADASVCFIAVLQLPCGTELVHVSGGVQLVQADLPRLLHGVRAVASSRGAAARAPGLRLDARGSLLRRDGGWAAPRQRVPVAPAALRRRAVGGPHALVVGDVLAADDSAVLLPDLIAAWHRALPSVEGDVRPELRLLRPEEIARVLHRHPQAPDARDPELPGTLDHHLVVEVPQHSCQVGSVEVLEGIVVVALRAVHV